VSHLGGLVRHVFDGSLTPELRMTAEDWLTTEFEASRPRLRGIAYRMLGSQTEADDAVQEAWLRLSRTDPARIENLGGLLTTVIGRVCRSSPATTIP
jgi:DNA-directed RNA polymerase specialized sigma24 family protein